MNDTGYRALFKNLRCNTDIRRHGNPAWQMEDDKSPETVTRTNGYTQAEDGKTEMSLVHFTLTNPGWKPSGDNEKYLAGLKTAAERDVTQLATMPEDVENPMMGSLTGLEDMGGSYRDHAHNILQNVPSPPPRPPGPVPSPPPNNVTTSFTSPVLRGGLSRSEFVAGFLWGMKELVVTDRQTNTQTVPS